MADQVSSAAQAVKDAVDQTADKVGELTTETNNEGTTPSSILDAVTGEYVSKSELKKRQKQREKDAKKAEKAAAAPPPTAKPKKAASAEEEEAHLNPNQYFEIRSRAIQKFRTSHEPNP